MISSSVVCTLFEGDYHYGVGALINSLCASGFRGNIWVGYRGNIPPWAVSVTKSHEGYYEFKVTECSVRFVEIEQDVHLSIYRTNFILDIWERWAPDATAILSFDPDITVKCEWWFLEQWIQSGIALCQDVNNWMPSDHPVRTSWMVLGQQIGLMPYRELDVYYNSGFIGIRKEYQQTIRIWKELLDNAIQGGAQHAFSQTNDKPYNFLYRIDQDLLNLATMLTPDPLSTVGPDGMDFVAGGYLLSHAIGTPKPWRKAFIRQALHGFAPSMADKLYLQHSRTPICLYSDAEYRKRLISLRIAAAISRFVRRS